LEEEAAEIEKESVVTRRKRRTRQQVELQIEQIQNKISTGSSTDKEIMQELGLKRANFYKYKAKIYKKSEAIQSKNSEKSLAFYQEMLNDRLTRIYRVLEEKVADKNTKARDVVKCALLARDVAINILRLEVEGLKVSREANRLAKKSPRETNQTLNLDSLLSKDEQDNILSI
jgi:ACT domain-containing protein